MSAREERMLAGLEQSPLFEESFPKRKRYSNDQWAALSEKQQQAWYEIGIEALEQVRGSIRHLQNLSRDLGNARYAPAVPALARLWKDCAVTPVRVAAGHALFAMQTEDARSVLESMIDDSDHLSRYLGIRSVFDRAPENAYDHFEDLFNNAAKGSPAVALEVLRLFCPGSRRWEKSQQILIWTEPRAPGWLKGDPRWLELCARLRGDRVFGRNAREVLRYADPEPRDAALKRARASGLPKEPDKRITRSGDLLSRYRSGEFTAVWREIRSYRHIDGAFRDEVLEVAEETMRRVARNADLLAERLDAEGWRALSGRLRTVPSPEDRHMFDRIEAISGAPIPPSLLAFWTVVGGIDWVWDYKCEKPVPDLGVDLPMDEMDPLSVDPAGGVDWLFKEWEEQKDQAEPDLIDPFSLELAPDVYHKANYSGGSGYAIELPFSGADPIFANEPHELPFVDYLRLCFDWAGFPGLDKHGDRGDVQDFVKRFGEGIELF